MYGGNGYEVLIGGQGNNVQYVNDPTRSAINRSTEDWQTRFDRLAAQAEEVHQQIDKITAQMNGLDPNSAAYQALQAQKDKLVAEHDSIVKAQDQLDQEYLQHTIYHVPDYVIGGAGVNEIHGSTLANFLIAGTGPTTFYSGGGDDTVTGTPGKDTFFIPPLSDNSNIVFTAQDDGYGNKIPVITVDAGAVHQVEQVHVRGITQIGVITGAGNNNVQVNLGSYALYNIAVQCTSGNDRIDLTGFQGGATVQAGSGNDIVVGGSPTRGVELDGGTGLSTYKVDGNGVQVRAEGSPSMLSIYANGALQSKITKTTFLRLSVQGQAGTNSIILGPLGGFSFPELIASAGPGSKTLDASAVSQRVTLLGGSGNDTLIGGSGPNYIQGGPGNDLFENFKNGDTVLGGGNDRFEAS